MSYSDNLSSVLASYEEEFPQRQFHLLEILNDTEYAVYLHARTGYWVLNDEFALGIVGAKLETLVNSSRALTDSNIEDALESAANDIVRHYQRVVGTTDRPGKEMSPPRPKHSGGWADDTVTLVRGYLSQVNNKPQREYPYEEF